MIRKLGYSLAPLLLLVLLASVACVLGYFILMIVGDVVELRKVISKTTQLLLVLSIFPLRAWLKLTWSELGFVPFKPFIRQMGWGGLLGLVTLLPVLLLMYGLDVQVFDSGRDWTLGKVISRIFITLLLATLISFVEEPLFRGLLLASFKRKMTVISAVSLSSLYYASLHFLKTDSNIPYQELTIGSGFQLMSEAFANCFNPGIMSALLSLWVVGVFLAVIRTQYNHTLGICIGCHAAWVWQIKVSKDFLNTNQQSEFYYLVSSYDGVVGPLITAWLSLLIVAFFVWRKYRGGLN